jgi:phage major head subunit gpT-like protein
MPGVIRDLRTFSVAVNAAFKTALQGQTADQSAQFTTLINMGTKRVEFPIAGTVGPLREWKGSRIIKSVMRDAYEIVAKKYEKTISIPVEDQEDDNLDVFMPAIRMLAQQAANWRSQQVHKALEANGVCYDGQPFFSSVHPERGVNVSNFTPGANPSWYLFDTTLPIQPMLWGEYVAPRVVAKTDPTSDHVFFKDEYLWGVRARGGAGYGLWQGAYRSKAALDAANFESAVTSMRTRIDEEGEFLNVTPSLLVVPPQLEFDALRLFGRATDATGGDNIHKDGMRWIVSNRLTGI